MESIPITRRPADSIIRRIPGMLSWTQAKRAAMAKTIEDYIIFVSKILQTISQGYLTILKLE